MSRKSFRLRNLWKPLSYGAIYKVYQFPRSRNQLFAKKSIYGDKVFDFYRVQYEFLYKVRVFFYLFKETLHQETRFDCALYWYIRCDPVFFFFLYFSHIWMHFLNTFFVQRHKKTRITFSLTRFSLRESSSFDCLCEWIKIARGL